MTAVLLESPLDTPPATAFRFFRRGYPDSASLWQSVDRIAGAAFCSRLDPVVITFAGRRIAAHHDVPDDLVDVLIAARLLSLAARLRRELSDIAPVG